MNARLYSEVNDFQLQFGKSLASSAALRIGDKVLDMGCGTGELTSFLAEKVGKDGQVIGVDPDLQRINVALHKHPCSHENIEFVQGESSSQFPHNEEQYYDAHFSNFVFQWLHPDEKNIFVKTAFRCLKPGGIIAIQSHESYPDVIRLTAKYFEQCSKTNTPSYYMKKAATENLLQKENFVIVSSKYYQRPYIFSSAQQFLTFFCASDYYDESSLSSTMKAELFSKISNPDGTVTIYEPTAFQVIAKKPDFQ